MTSVTPAPADVRAAAFARSADRTTWKSDSTANSNAASKAKDIIIKSCINSDRLPEQITSTLGTTARSLKEGDKDSFNGWTSDPYSVDISIEGISNEAFLTISLTRFQWTNDVGHGKKGFDLLPLNNEDIALFTNVELKPKDHLGSTPQRRLTFSFEDFEGGKKATAKVKLFDLNNHPFKSVGETPLKPQTNSPEAPEKPQTNPPERPQPNPPERPLPDPNPNPERLG